MAEEIELEALAQHRFVDLADAALPGGAGVRHDDVDAAEPLATRSKAARTEAASVTSQASAKRRPPIAFALALAAAVASMSSSATSAPAAANALRRGRADGAAAAGDGATWPASGFSAARAELGLLQRPVFACRTCRLR